MDLRYLALLVEMFSFQLKYTHSDSQWVSTHTTVSAELFLHWQFLLDNILSGELCSNKAGQVLGLKPSLIHLAIMMPLLLQHQQQWIQLQRYFCYSHISRSLSFSVVIKVASLMRQNSVVIRQEEKVVESLPLKICLAHFIIYANFKPFHTTYLKTGTGQQCKATPGTLILPHSNHHSWTDAAQAILPHIIILQRHWDVQLISSTSICQHTCSNRNPTLLLFNRAPNIFMHICILYLLVNYGDQKENKWSVSDQL